MAVLAGFGCGHSHDPDPTPADLSDVAYQGDVTDEALEALLAAKVATVCSVASPTKDASFPKGAPPTWTWSPIALAPGARPQRSFWAVLAGLIEGTAWAHGDPMNGPGYFVTIASKDNAKIWRTFLPSTSLVPSAADWAKVANATGPYTFKLRAATFQDNLVLGKVCESPEIAFQVTK